MSIVNRRNAMLGWLTWLTAKRVAKKKARAIVPGTVEGSRRPNTGAIVSFLAALGGAFWYWRRSSGDGDGAATPELWTPRDSDDS